jgi:hypothetical protein
MKSLGQNTLPNQLGERGIVSQASFDRPSPRGDFEAMARRRFQDPRLELVGDWYEIRVYEDEYINGRRIRKRKRVKLAPASMPIREVKKVKEEYLRPLNQGLVAVGSAMKFEEYVNTVYVPTEMPLLASSTQERYGGILKNYLVPTFGDRCLRELTPVVLQQYISGFKIKDSGQKTEEAVKKEVTDAFDRASVVKIRVVLSSFLR